MILIITATAFLGSLMYTSGEEKDIAEGKLNSSLTESKDFQLFLNLIERYHIDSLSMPLKEFININCEPNTITDLDVVTSFNIDMEMEVYKEFLENTELKKHLSAPNRIEKDIVNLDLLVTNEVIDSLEKVLKFYSSNFQSYRNEPEMLMNEALKSAGIPQSLSNQISGVLEMSFVEMVKSQESNIDTSSFIKK